MYYPIFPDCPSLLSFLPYEVYNLCRRNIMNEDKKQLECSLYCKASAELQKDVQKDLSKADGNLQDLLKEQDEKQAIKNNSCNHH